ncbi:hypothetical protein FHX73_1953 [Kitasatospora viridis]|uniref:Uncharacterized protein n=2 Tax=Kitasatospora viridis TaxID=281105 RepID=A0A561S984_9ACTN|nr:hypothetical protein FHX73_1953 [Kitasatospora viridis]
MGFPLRELVESEDYTLGQDFATVALESGFDGIAFPAGPGRLFAVFGEVGSTRYAKVARDTLIPDEILKKLGVEVLPDPESGSRRVGVS